MKKIEDNLRDVFYEEPIPQINQAKLDELNVMVRANKKENKFRFLKQVLLVSICCVIVIIGILIPIINPFNSGDNTQYYSDITAKRETLTEEYIQSYVNDNYPKYNIMFEKCNYEKSIGYYSPDTNKLLAIHIDLQEIDFPNTTIALLLVIDNQFIFEEKSSYTENAEITNYENYVLYKKVESSLVREKLTGYFKYKDYGLYLYLDQINEDLFNIFL